ncbi:MAG TPA: flavodoxin family protein [Firmicutes bacterium]|nr:flavodoxin family protein [Bacillota bacterium]
MSAGDKGELSARILAIMFSPRRRGNTEVMLEEAIKAAEEVPGITVERFDLPGKKIANCIACHRCRELGTCYNKDDFDELLQAWLGADGLLYASPVFHYGPPGSAKNALDKLGHVMFARFNRKLPRFCKVGGVLVQGSSRYGGQEATIGFFISSLLMMNCLPVSGDTPGSYVGGPGFAPTWDKGSIRTDEPSLEVARNVARRVAEMTLVVKYGLRAVAGRLPQEYEFAVGTRTQL